MFKNRRLERDLIAEALRSTIDAIVSEHYFGISQEPQVTSRLAADLEARLNGVLVSGLQIRVVTQEFPDRGPGSLERRSGADLYIGVEFATAEERLSKGLFVQSKWEGEKSSRSRRDLLRQCKEMTSRTKAAQVWLYGPTGVSVVPAQEVVDHPNLAPEVLGTRNLNEVFRDVLDCFQGDRDYGPPSGLNQRAALGVMLEQFAVPTGVSVSIVAGEDVKLDQAQA